MTFAEQSNSVEVAVAELIFDSATQAGATEGTRGTAPIARQLLFQAGTLCIDMCVQPKPGSDAVVLIGQLLDSRHPDHGIKDIPVQLLCEGTAISNIKTNEVGEFEFGIECPQDLQLSFGITGRRKLVVPLPVAPVA
ncbi:MAG TPA: hypothetical protein VLK33_12270 [Terriglobales bacterium]|nr:hypothetical protein [Terriglobales bacterium]